MANTTFTLKPLPPKPEEEKITFKHLPQGYQPLKLALDEETKEYFLVAESTSRVRPCDGKHEPGCRHFGLIGDARFSYLVYIGPKDDFAQVEVTGVRVYRGGGVFYDYVRANNKGSLFFPGTDKGKSPTNKYRGRHATLTDLSDRL